MSTSRPDAAPAAVLDRKDFDTFLKVLSKKSYQLLGPTVTEEVLVLDEIESADDLPIGMTDKQEAGSYRLVKAELPTLFGYAVGQQSWKQFLHLPEETLWRATRDGRSFEVTRVEANATRRALIGVRPCELAALEIHDKVLAQEPYVDEHYRQRRENLFIVVVNCTRPGGTCFCVSMNTGPRASTGFDLAFTEVLKGAKHFFVVEVGSKRGGDLVREMNLAAASETQLKAVRGLLDRATTQMGRELRTDDVQVLLQAEFDSPHWEEVAKRCLSCGNCTMVCPTCFCSTVEDYTDLPGNQVERRRRWDSCYAVDFSYIHGGSIRNSAAARYRQWLSHKLANWVDQFGTFGCVGCGRCITWCPAGIDLTEEISTLHSAAENIVDI
jgi:formate hydrogenlyase subunit 6/NADH:ubiquinone oxidoreductase subunit I